MKTIGKKGKAFWLLPLAAIIALAALACSSAEPEAPAAAPQQPATQQQPAPAAPAPAAPAAQPTAAAPAAPAAAEQTGQQGTLTVVLDNVGSPLYRNEKATWPDNMMNYYYGFQELLTTWEANDEGTVSDATCEAPMLALSWEYDLPDIDGDGEKGGEGDFTDPDNQGTVTVKLRQGVDFYVASGRHSEFTAEDAAWSFNDAGSNNPAATHSNAGEAGDWFKLWEATDKYTLKGHFRNYIADWLNGGGAGISSMCGDAIGVVSKTLFDEIQDDILTTPHGTGPFYVQEWRPNERIEATSRVDHWSSNPNFAYLNLIQASEGATRSAMLQSNRADISMVSIQDVSNLQNEGFKFHEGLNQILGQFIYMAGNYWSYKDPQTGEPVALRKGFTPDVDHPWIGDPRIECADADRTNTAELGAGCDATGFDYTDADKFSYETEHMLKAKAFREALIYAIDRDLIGETIVSGYGGAIYGTGHGGGIAFHQLHPEYKDRWRYDFDPSLAQQKLLESGVEEGFEFEYFCPAGNGTSLEVCQAVVGMWEEHLGLKPYIDSTAYSSRRPTMVGREINVIWQTSWGPNSTHAKLDAGGTIPVCCLWPIASAGGYNAGIEDNNFYNDFDITRVQEKGSPENLSTREEIMNRWWDIKTGTGIVEVPTLIGMNPETVVSWDLKPWRLTNSFDTVVYQPPQ